MESPRGGRLLTLTDLARLHRQHRGRSERHHWFESATPLRELVQELGIDWTDLWNVGVMNNSLSRCRRSRHCLRRRMCISLVTVGWIVHAGVSIWYQWCSRCVACPSDQETGEVTHIVMQHRATWSAEVVHGYSWRAIADGEEPDCGCASRGIRGGEHHSADIEVVGSYLRGPRPHGHTPRLFAFEKPGHEVYPRANDDESMEIEWVPIAEVPNLKLLTAMRADWPRFREAVFE